MEKITIYSDFPIEIPVLSGFPIATFDYRRVPISTLKHWNWHGFASICGTQTTAHLTAIPGNSRREFTILFQMGIQVPIYVVLLRCGIYLMLEYHIYISIFICILHIYIYTHVCIYIYIYFYLSIYLFIYVYIYLYLYIFIYVYTYIHTYIT